MNKARAHAGLLFFLLLLGIGGIIAFIGCDDLTQEPLIPTLAFLEVPNALLANYDSVYTYRVRLDNMSSG